MVEKANASSPYSARRATTLAAAALIAAAAGVPPAWGQDVRVDVLPGLIADEATLPLDAAGQPQPDAVPGARARQPLAADLEQRLRELSEQRGSISATAPRGAASAPIAPLPDDGAAPARVDAGDRDPDRLGAVPPPPRSR